MVPLTSTVGKLKFCCVQATLLITAVILSDVTFTATLPVLPIHRTLEGCPGALETVSTQFPEVGGL